MNNFEVRFNSEYIRAISVYPRVGGGETFIEFCKPGRIDVGRVMCDYIKRMMSFVFWSIGVQREQDSLCERVCSLIFNKLMDQACLSGQLIDVCRTNLLYLFLLLRRKEKLNKYQGFLLLAVTVPKGWCGPVCLRKAGNGNLEFFDGWIVCQVSNGWAEAKGL